MFDRIKHNIAELGWFDAALYALARLLARRGGWALHKYYFVAQSVGAVSLCRGRGQSLAVRLCRTQQELPPGAPRPASVLRARYDQGALCLAASDADGQLSGYLWLFFRHYQEDEVRARYRLAGGDACWDVDVWVRPRERLGFTFARLWDEAGLLLRARAVAWSCSRISAFNRGSLQAHRRLGALKLGSAMFLRCGAWQWTLASIAPYCHLSRRPGAMPQFSFDTGALARPPSMEPSCSIWKR